MDSPCSFPFPILCFPKSWDEWEFLRFLGWLHQFLDCTLRPTRPVFAQLQDWRNRLESATENQWFNGWGSLQAWSKFLERYPTVCSGQWAGHGGRLCSRIRLLKNYFCRHCNSKSRELTKPILLETAFTRITIWCSVVTDLMQSERKNTFSLFCWS